MPYRPFASMMNELHEQASNCMGSDDFEDEDGYKDNLAFMLERADTVTNWTELGRQALPQMVISYLCSRLSAQQGFAKFPDCVNQPIEKPIIVTGLRSGSTALHKLLSSAPNTQTLEFWMASFPQPRPPRNTWKSNPLYKNAEKSIEQLYKIMPELRSIHSIEADGADESHRLIYNFAYPSFMQTVWDSEFIDWIFQQSQRDAYAKTKKLMQLIGYGNSDKWVLKCPVHMAWMEETIDVFPDAMIVNAHRDPADVLPSVCSLLYVLAKPFQNFDKKEFGLEVLKYYGGMLNRYAKSRPALSAESFIDIDYRDLVSDPLSAVKKIYTQCDSELSPEHEITVAEWYAKNPKNKHGVHKYTGDEYGMSKALIHEYTADFCDYFSYRD